MNIDELLRHQARLLDLVNEAILVRDVERDTITYWNEGASRLYGWNRSEAIGSYIHHFLRTIFPRPLEDILKEFFCKGFWTGELLHTTRNGNQIAVSSRWTLLRDSSGTPIASLELNTDITERKRAEEALKAAQTELELRVAQRTTDLIDANERLRVLSRRLMEVQEVERRTIAHLHDEVGQALMAIKLNLREICSTQSNDEVNAYIADTLEIVDQVLHHVRNLALDLRPSLLDELGLVPALRWYAGRQADRAGWAFHFSAERTPRRVPTDIEIACFRIAQEALTNVARHARATNVEICLQFDDNELVIVIRDNGIGFNLAYCRRGIGREITSGLSGMEERVRLAGGTFTVDSAPGAGTEIRASFKIPSSTNDVVENCEP